MAATRGPRQPAIRRPGAAVRGDRRELGTVRRGVDEQGQPIEVVDPLADTLIPIARSQRDNPTAFLENRAVFGDLVDEPRFVEPYLWTLDSLHRHGARATLQALLHEGRA